MVKLKTETNTVAMRKRILAAFRAASVGGATQSNRVTAAFEHGQWWISLANGQQFSVVDATGPGSVDGLDFEEVRKPDEE